MESRFDFVTPFQMISKGGAIQEPSFGNNINADTLQRHFQSSLQMGSQKEFLFNGRQSNSNPYQDSREEYKNMTSRENTSIMTPMTPQLNGGGGHRMINQLQRPHGLPLNAPNTRMRKSTD